MSDKANLQVTVIPLPPLYSNCYLLSRGPDALVVDPGGVPDQILGEITRQNLNIAAILNTHGHVDHIHANAAVRRALNVKIGVHPLDAPMLASAELCLAAWAGVPFEEHQPDFLINEGPLTVGPFEMEVLHTPGHSVGSVCFYFKEDKLLVGGDLVFDGSVGRWDLPGGDSAVLGASIREKFLPLPDDVVVLPGHGAKTTVGAERRGNAILNQLVNGE